ncbi:MAG: VCBS repeat-containing protein [Bacteroidota bacterium]
MNQTLRLLAACLLLSACASPHLSDKPVVYETYCGNCHIAPEPEHLSAKLWEEHVLPEMGARLGIREAGYNPFKDLTYEERAVMVANRTYPEKPLLSQKNWESIKAFVLKNAPEVLPDTVDRISRNQALKQFTPHPIALDGRKGAMISFLQARTKEKGMLAGIVQGHLWNWTPEGSVWDLQEGRAAIVGYHQTDDDTLILSMGQMTPTEVASGRLVQRGQSTPVVASLHRPVQLLQQDLNGDGSEEIIIAEFGNHKGQLRMIADGKEKVLLPFPGIVRVVPQDMNGDGKDDLVVMASQGDEGIFVLYQGDNLQFSGEKVLRFHAIHGSSWFELMDFDGDGDQDLAVVNGDNADYSSSLKPYHGFRIYLNQGDNQFAESYFHPLHGATRVIARDFDQDGDTDFAIASFFPDFNDNPAEAFVYLNTLDTASFSFQSHTFPEATRGRWMVMEPGDVDQDGDEDIVLGSFTFAPAPTPDKVIKSWREDNVDLIWLENTKLHPDQ